jgi:threonine/homoserine/homoserine lactone efflux protein
MDASFLFKGLVIGLSIAAPVGPIGILCIRLALTQGRLSAIVAGLGAATADALYGALAGFGLSVASSALAGQQAWLHLVGGLFLCYLGVTTFLAKPAEKSDLSARGGLLVVYGSTLVLTIANPVTIISFAAVFAGLGLGDAAATGSHGPAAALVGGIFLGSALWWLLLGTVVGMFKRMVDVNVMRWINRTAGVILTGFGILAFAG